MTEFGVCIAEFNNSNIKVTDIIKCSSYKDAMKTYISKAIDEECKLRDDIWLVYIDGNEIIQFEQFTRKVKSQRVKIN